MIAAVIVFAAYFAVSAALLRWGVRAEGRSKTAYLIVEAALFAAGLAAAAVAFFTLSGTGGAVDDAEYVEWLREAFSLYAGISGTVAAVVILSAGLLILVRLAEKEKAGKYGRVLIFASPFVGSTVVFITALFAISLAGEFAAPVGARVTVFAGGLAFALHAVFLAAVAADGGVRKK